MNGYIEHAILSYLCVENSTIKDLTAYANLPTRLIVEAVIRLMKVGWVEMTETQSAIMLRATDRGKQVADRDELPRVRHPFSRIGKFAVDQLTGQLFRAKDLNISIPPTIEEHLKNGKMLKLPAGISENNRLYHQGEAISLLLDEDEEYVSTDRVGPRESERFAVVNVRGDQIEGLPVAYDSRLRDAILKLVRNPKEKITALEGQDGVKRKSFFDMPVSIRLDNDSLVVGGDAHRKMIISALKNARSWIVIHSTFVNVDSFRFLAPYLKEASDRGVRISLLWGQSETSQSRGQTLTSIQECQRILQEADGGASVYFQPFSTGSHAKILLFDGENYPITAVLGSCNWLSSSFDRLEVSLKVNDPNIVRLITIIASELARPMQGHWSALSSDLAGYAANLEQFGEDKDADCRAKLVVGAEHNGIVLQARDQAIEKVTFASHRVSPNARSLAIAPMLAAVKDRNLSIKFQFSRVEPELDSIENLFSTEEDVELASKMSFEQVTHPLLHAKFLSWDDDDLLVTSQNLLSADPGGGELFSEIGILVHGKNVANKLEKKLSKELSSSK